MREVPSGGTQLLMMTTMFFTQGASKLVHYTAIRYVPFVYSVKNCADGSIDDEKYGFS